MSKAIGIKAYLPEGEYDPLCSKFFGAPVIPMEWENDFSDNEIFFCQIRLSDIKEIDKECRLPHKGYLYVFLEVGKSHTDMKARVRYYEGEPRLILDDFNTVVDEYSQFNTSYLMELYEADEDECSTRLFGYPSDWQYSDEPPVLFMQFDPLDNEMGFLDSIDGYLYLFFDKTGSIDGINAVIEYS